MYQQRGVLGACTNNRHCDKLTTHAKKLVPINTDLNSLDIIHLIMYSSNAQAERTSLQSVLTSATAHSWGWNNPKLQSKIIMAGLFCDIGMRELPHLLTKKRFDYESSDVHDFESHPDRSAKILESIPGIPAEVIIIARQHHENDIGKGFPYRMNRVFCHLSLYILRSSI